MKFKDDRLCTDSDLIAWREEYKAMGLRMPGWNWDTYRNYEDYKDYIRKDLAKKKAEKEQV